MLKGIFFFKEKVIRCQHWRECSLSYTDAKQVHWRESLWHDIKKGKCFNGVRHFEMWAKKMLIGCAHWFFWIYTGRSATGAGENYPQLSRGTMFRSRWELAVWKIGEKPKEKTWAKKTQRETPPKSRLGKENDTSEDVCFRWRMWYHKEMFSSLNQTYSSKTRNSIGVIIR